MYNYVFSYSVSCYFAFIVLRKTKTKKPKTKKPKRKKTQKQHQPPFELEVGLKKLPFQLAITVYLPVATQTGHAVNIAILPPVKMAAGPYRRLKRRFEAISVNIKPDYLFS
jgi:hypothetical protein